VSVSYHFYAEIFYNNSRAAGIYKAGGGVIQVRLAPDQRGFYDEVRQAIIKHFQIPDLHLDKIHVKSLSKLG
jgi:hypothetical protein